MDHFHQDMQTTIFMLAAVCHLRFVDDVIILHPVIDFHGPSVVINVHVDLCGSNHTNITCVRLATDRRTSLSFTGHFPHHEQQ